MKQEISDLVVVIMAGGAGTRFWPLSTEQMPKQFLQLFGDRTLLQLSYDRIAELVPPERVLVLTHKKFVGLVEAQLPALPKHNIFGEPFRRDTAAAIALATQICHHRFGNPVMAVLTADQMIRPTDLFQRTLLSAVKAARASQDALYTFGVQPTYPATGYGYLQRGTLLHDDEGIPHYQLLRFREKPDVLTAQHYLDTGEFYWNSGMFVWTTTAIQNQLMQHLPKHMELIGQAMESDKTPKWNEALHRSFEQLTPISIDFGVMEKASDVRCVGSYFEWSDLGGWLALEEYLSHDDEANAYRGQLRTHQASHNLVFSEADDEVVALVGVKDLVVVRAGKRTLIVDRHRTEEIKALVQHLEQHLR